MYNAPNGMMLAATGAVLSFIWLPLGIFAICAGIACIWRARPNLHK